MPLDTQPLDTGRRALMVSALLVCFVGSLGFAQWICTERRSTLALSFIFPPELSQSINSPIVGIRDARKGTVGGQPRELYYFFYEHVPQLDPSMQAGEAARLFVETVNESPLANDRGQFWQHAILAHHSGVKLSKMPLANGGFAILQFTVVADRALGVLYSGSTPVTDADEELYNRVTGELRVIDLTAARRAKSVDRGN